MLNSIGTQRYYRHGNGLVVMRENIVRKEFRQSSMVHLILLVSILIMKRLILKM